MADLLDDNFLYAPLDQDSRQIRLLVLHAGSLGSPIEFCLETASFENGKPSPRYEALSYEWGSSTTCKAIFSNDCPIQVRENLWYALDALRHATESRVLWIDALCINQNDISERNHQVQQMADIYSQAACVLVWLGTATQQSRTAMAHLRKLKGMLYDKRKPSVSQMARSPNKWAALLGLLQNSYWSRVWIVQEIGLANKIRVICGEDQVPWEYFSGLICRLGTVHQPSLPKEAVLVSMSLAAKLDEHRIAHKKGSCTLLGLLRDYGHSACAVPHDKIYGFLGLANDYGRQDFSIDYEKTILELHADVILFQHRKIRSGEDLNNKSPPAREGLEADLFRFSQHVSGLLGCNFGADICSFNLAQSERREPAASFEFGTDIYSFNPAPLERRGPTATDHFVEYKVNLGLSTVTALRPFPQDPETWLASVAPIDKFLEKENSRYGDRNVHPQYRKSVAIHAEMRHLPIHDFVLQIDAPLSRTLVGEEPQNSGSLIPSALDVRGAATSKAIYSQGVNFWSDGGFLGMAPPGTKVGDHLYHIESTDVVLVVRPDGSTNPILGCAIVRESPAGMSVRNFAAEKLRPPPAVFRFDMPTFQLLSTVSASKNASTGL